MIYQSKYSLCFGIAIALLSSTTAHLCAKSKKAALKVGDSAPTFTLQGDDGKMYKLSDFKGQKVVLFFYPLDNSPVCTKQACSLKRKDSVYKDNGIQVFGINHQSVKKHADFKRKNNLPFPLLSDPSYKVLKAYGVYSKLFIKRVTYLIDNGKIVAILDTIDAGNHADQVLKAFGIN